MSWIFPVANESQQPSVMRFKKSWSPIFDTDGYSCSFASYTIIHMRLDH